MHRKLGSATILQLAFFAGKRREFPLGEIPMGQYSSKNYFKERKRKKRERGGDRDGENMTSIFPQLIFYPAEIRFSIH